MSAAVYLLALPIRQPILSDHAAGGVVIVTFQMFLTLLLADVSAEPWARLG